jgi:6-methylsalicylate decarboxylase
MWGLKGERIRSFTPNEFLPAQHPSVFLPDAGRIDAFYGKRPDLKEFAPEGIIGELRRLNYDTANATSLATVVALTKLVPTSQITYGTDYPYFGLGQFKDLDAAGLSAVDLESIGSGNATRLIPRLRS